MSPQRDVPGKLIVCGRGAEEGKRFVVNLLGQYYPGKSKYDNDSPEKRLGWFKDGLKALNQLCWMDDVLASVAFPYGIGCDAAGGDWEKYRKEIDFFSSVVKTQVFIIKKTV